MSEEPTLIIKGKTYAYPEMGKAFFTEPPMIEAVTGLSHKEFRNRYVKWATSLLLRAQTADGELEPDQEIEMDDVVWIGMVATAISREHKDWSRSQIAEFLRDLSFDEVQIKGGDAGPPDEAAKGREITSKNGTEPASTSNSESDADSKQSETPLSSGQSMSPTSREA